MDLYRQKPLTPEETKKLSVFNDAYTKYHQIILNVIQAIKNNDLDKATELALDPNTTETRLVVENSLKELLDLNVGYAKDINETGNQVFHTSQFILIGAAILGMALAIFLGLGLTRTIVLPLQKVSQVSQEIAEIDLTTLSHEMDAFALGDLTRNIEIKAQPIVINSKDELGATGFGFQ